MLPTTDQALNESNWASSRDITAEVTSGELEIIPEIPIPAVISIPPIGTYQEYPVSYLIDRPNSSSSSSSSSRSPDLESPDECVTIEDLECSYAFFCFVVYYIRHSCVPFPGSEVDPEDLTFEHIELRQNL